MQHYCGIKKKENTRVFLLLLLQRWLLELSWIMVGVLSSEENPALLIPADSCSCPAPLRCENKNTVFFQSAAPLHLPLQKKKKGKKKLGNIFLTLCADTVLCIENFCCFLGAFILLWNNFHVSGRIFFLTNKKNTSQRQQLMEIAEALECFCGGASQTFPYLTENDVRFCTCLS